MIRTHNNRVICICKRYCFTYHDYCFGTCFARLCLHVWCSRQKWPVCRYPQTPLSSAAPFLLAQCSVGNLLLHLTQRVSLGSSGQMNADNKPGEFRLLVIREEATGRSTG